MSIENRLKWKQLRVTNTLAFYIEENSIPASAENLINFTVDSDIDTFWDCISNPILSGANIHPFIRFVEEWNKWA